jgi:hypothetical protein
VEAGVKVVLRFEMQSYWHAGTGRGDGWRADAVVQRTREGLPYLPGRTVKGLLRAAVSIGIDAGLASSEEVDSWFGTRLVDDGADRVHNLEAARFRTRQGLLRFSSATLGRTWEAWAGGASERELAPLFVTLASTAINEEGVASERSLRTIEVAVPMTLQAFVEGPEGRWAAVLTQTAPFLRALGSGRNRGSGRVWLTAEEVP